MKSKITKIQILKKGIAIALSAMFLVTPITYATTSLDDSYLESSLLDQLLYGTIGSTVKEIEEYFKSGETTLYITNETQLRAFAEYVNNGNSCKGKEIILLNDIEIDNENEWVPIGNIDNPFSGTFNGKGNIISGVRIIQDGYDAAKDVSNVGLFGFVYNGTITRVNFNDIKIDAKTGINIGSLVGYLKSGNISLCDFIYEESDDVSNYEILGSSNVGGIVGKAEESIIDSCNNDNFGIWSDNDYSMMYVGGIVGYTENTEIKNCSFSSHPRLYNSDYVGGIVGYANNAKIDNCITKGTFSAGNIVGGIVGWLRGTSTVKNCSNDSFSTVSSGSSDEVINATGGIVGEAYNEESEKIIISNSLNTSSVYSKDNNKYDFVSLGGIVGCCNANIDIVNCLNEGNVMSFSGTESEIYEYEGGIIGNSGGNSTDPSKGTIQNCVSSVEGLNIIGDDNNNIKIQSGSINYDILGANIPEDQGVIESTLGVTKVIYTITKNGTVISEKEYFKAGDILKVTANFDKYLAKTYGPLAAITEAPTLKINDSIEMTAGKINANNSSYTTSIEYTYTVQEGDNFDITSLNLYRNGTIYAVGSDYATVHPTISVTSVSTSLSDITIDTTKPIITTKVYVENMLETERYTAGKEILFEVKTSETIQGLYEVPQIQVSFSESGIGKYNYLEEEGKSGLVKCKDAVINLDGTTTWTFSYQVQERDEGELEFTFTAGEIVDLAGNRTNIKDLYKPSTTVTSELVTGGKWAADDDLNITYEFYRNSVLEKNKVTSQTYFTNTDDLIVVATYDKVLYVLFGKINNGDYSELFSNSYKSNAPSIYLNNEVNLKSGNAESVEITKDNTTKFTYKFEDIAKNYGIKTLTQISSISSKNDNNYEKKVGQVTLDGKIGYSDNRYTEYTDENAENVKYLSNNAITKMTGLDDILIDPIGVSTKIEKSNIYADTTAPTVEITANKTNPTKADLIKYTFKFSEVVEGFTAKDVTVNNGVKVTEEITIDEEVTQQPKFVEVVKGLEYTLEVEPTITAGNEGVLQVIVEEGAVKDLVAINNVRQENNITIDKVKPTFTSYEINEKAGNITIELTFSEKIADASKLIPTLTVGGKVARGSFEDLDTTKEGIQIAQIFDNNKVRYVYNESGADGGKVEVILNGTVKDIAGNDSERLSISVENTITLEQEVIKNGKDTYSFEKNGKAITDFTNPTYFVKGNTITVVKDTETEVEVEVDGQIEEQTKIVTTEYTYKIEEDLNLSYMQYMNIVEKKEDKNENGTIEEDEIIFVPEFYTTRKSGSIDISEVNIYFDTISPKVITEIIANNPKDEVYTTEEEFTIKATTSEVVQDGYIAPEISVKFGENVGKFNDGKVQYVETVINENGTTTWVYRYVVSIGDEGEVSLNYVNGKVVDLAGNTTTLTSLNSEEDIFLLNGINVDATAPTVEISVKEVENNITNSDSLEYTLTWSEEVTGFATEDVKVNNGTKVQFVQNTTNKKVYTMIVDTNVESGNTGDIQVIIEQDACQDQVGLSNVRTESVIRVDKRAPILIGIEASVVEPKTTISDDVETVKEYYKAGEEVVIVATFDENIANNTVIVPTLALQFSESGNAKSIVSPGSIEGNKITYTYTINDKDMGMLSIKGFNGTVVDAAGNVTTVTKRTLDGDTIIADTVAPTLVGITAIAPNFEYDNLLSNEGETKRYGIGKEITIVTEYSENIYNLSSDNMINNINDNTKPVLKLKFGSSERTANYSEIKGNKIYYTYTIVSGDNGDLSIVSLTGNVSDIAGNSLVVKESTPNFDKYEESITKENIVEEITADTTPAKITFTTSAVNYDDDKNIIKGNGYYYREGAVITITASTDEYVYSKDNNNLSVITKETEEKIPTLGISFSTSGVAKGKVECTNVEYLGKKTVFTYTYEIQKNENGTLSLSFAENQEYDIALNGNASNTQEISSIIADTERPYYDDQPGIEYAGSGYKVTFNENLYYLDDNNIVQSFGAIDKAPLLKFEGKDTEYKPEVSENAITYAGEYINAKPYLGASRLCDRAGNLYAYYDQEAPELVDNKLEVTNPITETYNAGEIVTIVATFDEKLEETSNAPTLQLQFVDSGDVKGTVSNGVIKENTITYNYTIVEGDNGILSIKSFTGTGLKDLAGNEWVAPETVTLSGNKITADTIAPIVTITSDVERTNKEVVTYTFTWNEEVTGFDKDDIEVINGSKGELKQTDEGGKVYTLSVDTTEEGRQIIKVDAEVCIDVAGNLNTERVTYNNVVIDYTKPSIRAKVNGGAYVIDTDSNKSTLKEIVVVNEELSKFEYIWSTSETTPEVGWETEDVSEIIVDSDINLNKEIAETGTYYLYIKATDLAGNTLITKTKGFVIEDSKIILTPNITEATNQDITVIVEYGVGLTENRKAGVSGKTQSADSTKVIINENGIVYAEAMDKAGNKVYSTKTIDNIDKIAPEATIEYTANEDGSITATISFNEENVTITNNSSKNTYTFEENGQFTFEFKDNAGNSGASTAEVNNIDRKAPTITFKYTLTSTTLGNSIGATIITDEDAIISYSWDNENWTTPSEEEYTRTQNAVNEPKVEGTYILYAKATDKAGNASEVQTLEFKVVEKIEIPEIIFEDLPTVQVDGVKYVKVSADMTAEIVTSKMNAEALCGITPQYINLTEDNKLKTGSEITINGRTKYIVVVNGDVNCDGEISFLGDVVMTNNYRIGQVNLKTIQRLAADVNNNGSIDFISDIVAINNYRLGIIKSL